MNDIKAFYHGTEYHSPERKIGWLTRLFPSVSFYLKNFLVVWKASSEAKRGTYNSKSWHDSSAAVVRILEETGCRFDITGIEHFMGLDRPCVFIGNHMSTLETFVLPSLIMPHSASRPSALAALRVMPASASSGVRPNRVAAMFIIRAGESAGEVPGFRSVATAIGTPCLRKRSTGGFRVSFNA